MSFNKGDPFSINSVHSFDLGFKTKGFLLNISILLPKKKKNSYVFFVFG